MDYTEAELWQAHKSYFNINSNTDNKIFETTL